MANESDELSTTQRLAAIIDLLKSADTTLSPRWKAVQANRGLYKLLIREAAEMDLPGFDPMSPNLRRAVLTTIAALETGLGGPHEDDMRTHGDIAFWTLKKVVDFEAQAVEALTDLLDAFDGPADAVTWSS